MNRLWSPWRSQFLDTHEEDSGNGSPFTRAWGEPEKDEENMLLYRGRKAFIIFNKYPYNAGHLLVVPVRETNDFLSLDDGERGEMMELLRLGTEILKKGLNPAGFNIGMNLGRTAGAAIDTHLHFHIVPRWNGDTNFMPVLDEVRVISHDLAELYRKLVRVRDEIVGGDSGW